MIERKRFYETYDLDALTYKYGRIGGPAGLPCQGQGGVKTTGSSTTVTSVTDTVPVLPFGAVNVGDLITFVVPPEVQYSRKVATKTSGDQISVDSAVTLAGTASWYWYPFRIGTTSEYGWHHVSEYRALTVYFDIATLASGGVGYSIETRMEGSNPVVLKEGSFSSPGTYAVQIEEVVSALRVGLKAVSSYAGTDSISVWVAGDLRGGRR